MEFIASITQANAGPSGPKPQNRERAGKANPK